MFTQESTFHDRQCVIDENTQSTASTTFVDVTDATLTTTDLGSTGTYLLWFSVLLQSSLNNTEASFRLVEDGSPVGMERHIILRIKEQDVGYTILGCIEAEDGVVMKLQWKTDIGTITLQEFNIIVDGIPKIRVQE